MALRLGLGNAVGSAEQAIIDIGSNTVRLVIYGEPPRAPAVLYNEKVTARLGKGVAEDGRLSEKSMNAVLAALGRFETLLRLRGVKKVQTVATAAALAGSMDCDATHMIIHQGVEMGRPSEIFAEIRRDEAEKVVRVAIYGEATVIADGNFLRLP